MDRLAEELTLIREAGYVEEGRLPWRGIKAEKERWRLAFIAQNANRALELMDALRGCIRSLDTEELPMLLEQARTCINNISGILDISVGQMARKGGGNGTI